MSKIKDYSQSKMGTPSKQIFNNNLMGAGCRPHNQSLLGLSGTESKLKLKINTYGESQKRITPSKEGEEIVQNDDFIANIGKQMSIISTNMNIIQSSLTSRSKNH
jgi:hypothetical protein